MLCPFGWRWLAGTVHLASMPQNLAWAHPTTGVYAFLAGSSTPGVFPPRCRYQLFGGGFFGVGANRARYEDEAGVIMLIVLRGNILGGVDVSLNDSARGKESGPLWYSFDGEFDPWQPEGTRI